MPRPDQLGARVFALYREDIANLKADEIMPTEYALHRNTEKRNVARKTCQFESDLVGPDMPMREPALLHDDAALVSGGADVSTRKKIC